MNELDDLKSRLGACAICTERFEATKTKHAPRPIVWFDSGARLLIAGQAPGLRVHESGRPFTDPSGDRLRDWLGIDDDVFYDRSKVAILPMAFCFPGYNASGSDLPPPKICAETWRSSVLGQLPNIRLTLLIGGYAQAWHLKQKKAPVTETVKAWETYGENVMPLPHPSWRNTGWIKRNPWFETDLLPVLKARVAKVLAE